MCTLVLGLQLRSVETTSASGKVIRAGRFDQRVDLLPSAFRFGIAMMDKLFVGPQVLICF